MLSRHFFVWLHRWVGLAMAGFLIVVSVTGSLLTFWSDLERLVCPQIYAAPRPGVPRLDLATLAERAGALIPQCRVAGVEFFQPDQVWVSFEPHHGGSATSHPCNAGFNQLLVDPWTGAELGRRNFGDILQGRINLMPFIYQLHSNLKLSMTGYWILGGVALLWTVDCFVGFYLTLPITMAKFWRRWRPSWLIKRGAAFFRLNFDLHRAGGLWLWAALFIFAWSSVMLNCYPVYDRVTGALFDYTWTTNQSAAVPFRAGDHPPRLDWRAAQEAGARLMAEQATIHGFTVERVEGLAFVPVESAYYYDAKTSRDVSNIQGTALVLDGDTGAFRSLRLATGEHTGNTVSSWLYALHTAEVFGLPYRIFVCVLGLVITLLSVTGLYIWWKKLRARKFAKARRSASTAAETVTG
ncbi:MAG TPA: PepSY-associated TM helix domain-containing protein [Candidatus Micrarchaeia archaeon]|nr:PepSY-associated TM helix domain-containing protein [Candidatus Micrarchaeia archaeon]